MRMHGTYVVEDGERGNDGVNKVNTHETTSLVCSREERHEGTADDTNGVLAKGHGHQLGDLRRDNASDDPCPTMRFMANTKSNS
jgi:hypothetical protein